MKSETGCLICGEELVYSTEATPKTCYYCGKTFESFESCAKGHFVCNECHSKDALSFVTDYCLTTENTDPVSMAADIMKHPSVKMHGPEHHYIVPAVLLTSYYKRINNPELLESALEKARKRSGDVKGGFCGYFGACGAGVGTGITMSIITGATPVSHEGFKLANEMTSRSLHVIAENGGPRCCKRDTFIAIKEAMNFMNENLGTDYIPDTEVSCEFYRFNNECKLTDCIFYQ